MTIRDIAISFGFDVDSASEKKVQNTVNNLKNMATRALSAIGIGFSLVQLNRLVEEWDSVNRILKNVSTNLQSQVEVQNKILDAANACRVAYSDMCNYATDLVKTGSRFFSNVEDAADFLSIVNKAFKVSGATESQVASLNSVLTQTFNTGKLSASGFNTIMNQSPDIIRYLAESLGISERQVKALGLAGNITAKQLYTAFQNSTASIDEAYQNLDITISESLLLIRNNFGTWIAQMNEAYGITNYIARLLTRAFNSVLTILKTLISWFDRLVNLFGSAQRAVAFLGATMTAVFIAIKWQSILSTITNAVRSFGTALAAANIKLLAIIAVVLLAIAVIDDLIAFMNGDESLIGSIFEKFGIDGEVFRQLLLQIVNLLKSILVPVLTVLQAVMSILGKLLNAILTALKPFIDILAVIINFLLELLNGILQPIVEILTFLANILAGNLSKSFEFLGNIIDSIINGPLRGFIDFMQQIVKFISAVFKGDWDAAWKALGNIPIAIINGIIGAFESMLNFFVNSINSITAGLSSLWTWLGIPAIPEIPQVQFGRLSYLAEGGYIGKDKPTPVVIGDNKQEGEIVSPISKMRETVLDALRLFVRNNYAMNGGAAQALQRQAVNNSITQNISIYNTFEGSKDMQRTTSNAMRNSSRDITDELANAIAYLR